MVHKKPTLPPLSFGHLWSNLDTDLNQMRERINSITNWASEFDVLRSDVAFQHRTAVYAEDSFRLMSVSSSPTVMKVDDPFCTMAIPIWGTLHAWIGKGEFEIPARQAMFYPCGKRHTEGGVKSTLLISVSEQRLFNTARTMLGEQKLQQFDVHTPRIVDTKHGPTDLVKIIGSACSLIDQFNGERTLLRNFLPDEQIVRAFVMMLNPQDFFIEEKANPALARSKSATIRLLCEYLAANLEEPISMTTMESLTGLSTRVLQQEFKKRFEMSPMQWLREQRLARARQLLLAPSATTNISNTAIFCGFDNFSAFANRYRQRFGELPSETLKNALES